MSTTDAEACSRAAEIARERGSLELCEWDGQGACAIFGPELADLLDEAAGYFRAMDQPPPPALPPSTLASRVRDLAQTILFAAEENPGE